MLAAIHVFDLCLCTHGDAATAGAVGILDALHALNDTGGREIRTFDIFHQPIDRDVRIIDHGREAIDHFRQVVRRDIRRHADGDAVGTIHEQVRDAGRQDERFLQRAVIVRHEIDGILVDVAQHFHGDLRHTHFRITHRSRGVAVDRAEVPVPIDQRVARREILRHADSRLIDCDIAVRVVLT